MGLPILYSFRRCPYAMLARLALEDGTVLEESLDVMRWALDTSDAGETLAPDQGNMRDALALIARMDVEFKPKLDDYKYLYRSDKVAAFEARDAAMGFLHELDIMLAGHSYLYGQKRSAADVGVAPFVRQFAHVDRDWFYAQPWDNLSAWLKVFLESEAFLRIMKKYPKWVVGDDLTVFPPRD